MPQRQDEAITLAFVGYAGAATAERAAAFEDAVLPLVAAHGGRVEFRGRRAAGQDEALPAEVHLLWFPSRGALDAYLADDRRHRLLAEHGEVFTAKQAVEVRPVVQP